MRIALIGYGKMGQAIAQIAESRGHEITHRFTSSNLQLDKAFAESTDLAIEFTRPESAVSNISACLELGVPVVTGTTGWNEQLDTISGLAESKQVGFFHASNFSVGMNLFMAVNRFLSEKMNNLPSYQPRLHEIHHIHKLDAPSGTAITLGEELVERVDRLSGWNHTSPTDGELPITDERIGEVPGTHTITWENNIDKLEFTHEAKNRTGFAEGAVLAAEYLSGKTGVHTMRDMLGL